MYVAEMVENVYFTDKEDIKKEFIFLFDNRFRLRIDSTVFWELDSDSGVVRSSMASSFLYLLFII